MGLIVEVFEVEKWYEKERGYNSAAKKFGLTKIGYGFTGSVAPFEIRNLYINKSIHGSKKKGAASVIKYSLYFNYYFTSSSKHSHFELNLVFWFIPTPIKSVLYFLIC